MEKSSRQTYAGIRWEAQSALNCLYEFMLITLRREMCVRNAYCCFGGQDMDMNMEALYGSSPTVTLFAGNLASRICDIIELLSRRPIGMPIQHDSQQAEVIDWRQTKIHMLCVALSAWRFAHHRHKSID